MVSLVKNRKILICEQNLQSKQFKFHISCLVGTKQKQLISGDADDSYVSFGDLSMTNEPNCKKGAIGWDTINSTDLKTFFMAQFLCLDHKSGT